MFDKLLLCDCRGSVAYDPDALATATGIATTRPCREACGADAARALDAMREGAAIACTQEADRFAALAVEAGVAVPPLLDLRDRAGWAEDGEAAVPKMAALVAAARLPGRPDRTMDAASEGLCLVLGDETVALAAAERLRDHLSVTVLLSHPPEAWPEDRGYDVAAGRLRGAAGAFGGFEVRIDGLRQRVPGGRGTPAMTPPRDGAMSACDMIVDLRRDPPLFPAPTKRDGYLRADPGSPQAVADAVLAASHMVGTFEKTLHVRVEPVLCAHSRAEQTGCTRCLDLCPTGAITPSGEHVAVDPMVCAGCGACSAACPSGAISYDAPPVDAVMTQVQVLATAYRAAGGAAPRLLVHDAHGAEAIRLSARYGTGLPADTVPLALPALGAFGHAEALAALAAGFADVTWLPGPDADAAALEAQVATTRAVAGADAAHVAHVVDPTALRDALPATARAPVADPVRPMGSRRQIARQAATALTAAPVVALPEGAPYGAVLVDTDACTLCLSCVSLCPSGALGDNPDRPQLRFQEDACLQCGLCANVCPEDAITLEARLDLTPAALEQRVLHEEAPFDCVECGAPFGVASTIAKITEKLAAHPMFDGDRLRTIQMCDDCRVRAQVHAGDAPFAGAARPRVRTTMDELALRDAATRRDH